MSVLSFPRIYFQGFMQWDPCTFNNNDWQAFQTYDGVNAALNWPFLETEGITQQNFQTTFRPWAIKLQPDAVDSRAARACRRSGTCSGRTASRSRSTGNS
ncbi:MAG TPA: hypothetical protein VH087_08725 [Thermoanaerobaculia bacterium]|jgi:hypothetical protein|nr:hypothetical protein [Thermoanaerobaculia bacterium]